MPLPLVFAQAFLETSENFYRILKPAIPSPLPLGYLQTTTGSTDTV